MNNINDNQNAMMQYDIAAICDDKNSSVELLPKFSLFQPPIGDVWSNTYINIRELHERITSDTLLESICYKIKNEEDKKERNKIKDAELPYVTPSGTFLYRADKNLIEATGYLCIDIDNLSPQELTPLKKRFKQDLSIPTLCWFTSPSGRGLKWFIKIPPVAETHGQYFDALSNYIQINYKLEVDESCRNISRACYLSFDDDAYLAKDFIEVEPLNDEFLNSWFPKEPEMGMVASEHIIVKEEQIHQLELLVAQIVDRKKDITSQYKDWIKIGHALCELGEDGRKYFHEISQFYAQYSINATNEKFTELLGTYDGKVTLGTLFWIAKVQGITYQKKELNPIKELLNHGLETNFDRVINGTFPRTALQRLEDASKQPPINQLVGSVWNSGELHILFGDNGTGKSVLAVQMADAISKGVDTLDILPNANGPQKVLFYDFENSDKQFQIRYQDEEGNHYPFSENLFMDNIDFQQLPQNNTGRLNTDELVVRKIIQDIEKLKPQVLIIDNLTYLKTETTQDVKVALDLIRKLNELKRKYSLSILVLAHTPKIKGGTSITNNDLAGSKQLSNLVDSISAIGKSTKGTDIKYIKHIKCRTGVNQFDTDSVITCRLHKDGSFLRFSNQGLEHEREHLRECDKEEQLLEKKAKQEEVISLHKEGLSLREIGEKTGLGKSTVSRWIKEISKEE